MVWGIATQEYEGTVADYAEALGLTYPILLDYNGKVHDQYEQVFPFPTGAYPQDWVIDTEGRIVYANNRFELAEMTAAIDAARE